MASTYTGLYVIHNESGQITDVQVVDIGGNSMPLPLEDYIKREVKPPILLLPSQEEYYQRE